VGSDPIAPSRLSPGWGLLEQIMRKQLWIIAVVLIVLACVAGIVSVQLTEYNRSHYVAKPEYFHEISVNGIVYVVYTGPGQLCAIGEDGKPEQKTVGVEKK